MRQRELLRYGYPYRSIRLRVALYSGGTSPRSTGSTPAGKGGSAPCSSPGWTAPPRLRIIELPRAYNAAVEFIDANLSKGREHKTAFIDAAGRYTYGELAERVNRAGNALRVLGAGMETRVLMCMLDDIDFPAVFWGAIKAGCVPIPINTLLTSERLRPSAARLAGTSSRW